MPAKNKPCPCGSGRLYQDCCFLKKRAAKQQGQKFVQPEFVPMFSIGHLWAPAILFLALAVYEMTRATSAHNFAQYAFYVHNDVMNALSTTCFVLAGLFALFPPLRRIAAEHLDKLSKLPARNHLIWIGATFAGILIWLGFVRYCQYRGFLLPQDTADDVQYAYTFLHYRTAYYSSFGIRVFSTHFFMLMPSFSPILLIWNSPLAIIFMQHLFVCSAPIAIYAVAYFLTSSSMAGFCGLLLASSSPYFYELITSNIHHSSLSAMLPWAVLCSYLKYWAATGFFFLLMLTCAEQVPFIFVGLGLYSIYWLDWKKQRSWLIGGALTLAAVGLWLFEMRFIHYFSGLEGTTGHVGQGHWQIFYQLVPDGTADDKVLPEMIHHPLRTVFTAIGSQYRFYPVLRVIFSMGFLCLLAPFQFIVFCTAVLPQFLAAGSEKVNFFDFHPISYSDFGLHQPAYIFGPLLWATAHGIKRAYDKLSPRAWQSWLLVWTLFFSGFGFKYAHRTLHPNWRTNWFDAMPRVMVKIPPNARIWVDDYASAPMATRRWFKIMEWGPGLPSGYHKLFKPDYVLFDKAFAVQAQPPYRDRMLTYFAQNKYEVIADDTGVMLLKAPVVAEHPEEVPTEWFELPQADPKLASSYAQYLLNPSIGLTRALGTN